MNRKKMVPVLATANPNEIRAHALSLLNELMDGRISLNKVSDISGISRTTLYKWRDPAVELEAIGIRDAAWFIIICEQNTGVRRQLNANRAHVRKLTRRGVESKGEK